MEDRINLSQLMDLKAAFDRADTDHGGTLDIDEFLAAFGNVLGKNLTEEQLTHLFMKIDANSDGTVDWDEFTNFMLLENENAGERNQAEGSATLSELDPRNDPNPKSLHHRDMMDSIMEVPKVERLFTSSRDGTLRVWKADTMQHVKTVRVSDSWVTSMTHFPQSNRIAVASMDRTISFYDASTDKVELVAQLTGLETSPLCLGSWNDQLMEKLIVGDDCGNIALYDTSRPGREGHEATMSATSYRTSYDKGRHADWISKVCYYADLNLMISSSLDGTLKLSELGRRNAATRTLGEAHGPHAPVKRGVYSFAWSSGAKLLASCGLERTISLWNPYTRSSKPLAMLQGHTASVQHLCVSEDGHQLFSCAVDKCLKVWDLRSHKCVQTIAVRESYRPEDKISAMAFQGGANFRLLTGTTRLRPWPLIKAAKRSAKRGHSTPLVAALYNSHFNQVVSGDEAAQVCVWDVEQGEMVFLFNDLHSTKMTAMAFDEAGRRLITGANDGTVRVWNFSNGQLLQQLRNEGSAEASCLTFIVEGQNRFVVSGGWNRKVMVWRDEQTASAAPVDPDRVMNGHDEDILSIAYSPPNLLATSGYDGRLLVWNMDSAILKFKLSIPHVEKLDVDQRAMWQVLFLERRSQALVSASADGKLRFWNVKEGVLVWEMASNHKNGEGVVSIATEPTNSFLFSADAAGYVKIWDVSSFLNVAGLDQKHNVVELAHWRAHGDKRHDACITSIDYIERHRLILTGGSDSKIKLWRWNTDGVTFAGALGEASALHWQLSAPEFRLQRRNRGTFPHC